jgi:type IV secretory pathway VirB9-like protein
MKLLRLSGALFLIAACGTTKVVQYAEPLPKRVQAPAHVDLSNVDGPWKRKVADVLDHDVLAPEPPAPPEPEKTTAQAIRDANSGSLFDPRDADEDGVVRTWVYDPDVTYQLFACPLEILQIRLAPGEKLVEHPILGNMGSKKSPYWSVLEEMAGDGHAKIIQFVMIRPTREGVPKQRMHLLTNVGPYEFELNVLPKGEECMHGVRFRHPQHELNQLVVEAEQTEARHETVSARSGDGCTSAAYDIEVMQGSPRWVPTMVWRECNGDRARVHIQFRGDVAWSKIPALQTDGGVANYDYDPSNKVMTVMGLFNHAKLQLGSKEQPNYEVVAIHALKESKR